jgi:tetratricopeptide (TPR) repeat protein
MSPAQGESKAPWILVGVVLGALFVAGALLVLSAGAGWYVYLYGNPFEHRQVVPHTKYSTKAELPEDSRGAAQQASAAFAAGDFAKAATYYQQIIDKHPDCLYAWSNLGVVRFQQNDYEGAREALERCVAMSPNDAFSLENLGIVYYQLKRFDDGIHVLSQAIALTPNDSKAHNYLGCCYAEKGRQLDAEAEFKRSIDLNRDFGDPYFNLALVYSTVKPPDVALAKQNYQHAVQLGIARDPRLEKRLTDEAGTP